MTELDQWKEWHAQCALAKCGEPTRETLRRFVYSRFCKQVRDQGNFVRQKLAYDPEKRLPTPDDAWREFESDAVKDIVAKRAAKDYLMERAQKGGIDYLQAAATLRVRETVRRWLCFEVQRHGTLSLATPLDGDDELTWGDLIEAGCHFDDKARREFEDAADWVIEEIGPQIKEGHRQALALLEAGLRFSWPEAKMFSGRSDSALANYRDEVIEFIDEWVKRSPEFDGDTLEAKEAVIAIVVGRLRHDAYKASEVELKALVAQAAARLSKDDSGKPLDKPL